jgi:putative SOS response-associated peptidase YedK
MAEAGCKNKAAIRDCAQVGRAVRPRRLMGEMEGSRSGNGLLTFTVITTDPNEVVQPLHDRMPVIIPEKDYGRWLQSGDPDRPPIDLLRPLDAGKMTAWKVGAAVGDVKNDRAELLEQSAPNSLFGR